MGHEFAGLADHRKFKLRGAFAQPNFFLHLTSKNCYTPNRIRPGESASLKKPPSSFAARHCVRSVINANFGHLLADQQLSSYVICSCMYHEFAVAVTDQHSARKEDRVFLSPSQVLMGIWNECGRIKISILTPQTISPRSLHHWCELIQQHD